MKVYAVVPVKRLSDSKKRLSALLSPMERRLLVLAMLEDVLEALKSSSVDGTLVVSEDSEMHTFAEKHGASYLSPADSALNASLEESANWCLQRGAGAVLVLPADVPLVIAKDVDGLVSLGLQRASVVISPSWNGGTNALFQNPPKQVPTCFGSKSFSKHVNEARCRGVEVRVYGSGGLALDVDSVEDLKRVFEAKNQTCCKRVLEQFAGVNPKVQAFLAEK
jgi:2-phospho-L-lactate/phosphoenolpyruvate guanylyltransferase